MKQKMMSKLTTGCVGLSVILIALMLISGCTALRSKKSTSAGSTAQASARAENAPIYYDFGDVLVPKELKVDKDDSFVFRTPGMTVGMLSLKGRVQIRSLTNFFENKMPVDGWRMVSSIEGQRTMMLFQKNNRWCVINMDENQLSSTVEIWVSTSIPGSGMGLTK